MNAQRLLFTFRKDGSARFLSHLDLTAVFEYSARRAGLPLSLSAGFNPRPRMSVAASLALGYIGEAEILEISLRESLPPDEVAGRLGACLPKGIEILSVEESALNGPSAAARLHSAIYRVDLPESVADLSDRVATTLAETSLIEEEIRDGSVRRRDIRPMIVDIECRSDRALGMTVSLDGGGSVRPELVLQRLGVPASGCRITRERLILSPA